jgi:acetoacetate decarboxylase
MKSMYEISREAMDIVSALEENEGELNPSIESALRINQNELQEKAINYAYAIKTVSNDVDAISEEIKRLQALKKAKDNTIQRLKDTVVNAMQIYGLEKVETPTLKLSIRRSEAVEVDDNFDDDIYMIKKVTYTPDKTRLKEAIKRGESIQGVTLKENYNLQIK